MQNNPDAPSDFTVAFATFVGFFAVTIFAAGIGGYIGRHSTSEPSQAAAAPGISVKNPLNIWVSANTTYSADKNKHHKDWLHGALTFH